MTMKRNEKRDHQRAALDLAEGRPVGWRVLFQSPKVIAEHNGRTRPTVEEYYKIKMGRRRMDVSRLDTKIDERRNLHRKQRTVGGRRVTGR